MITLIENLRKTCSSIYVTTSGDEWYRMVAELQWGKTFWECLDIAFMSTYCKIWKNVLLKHLLLGSLSSTTLP